MGLGAAMDRHRFTIGNLAAAILFIAIALAALRDGSASWDRALFSATLLVLLTSILLAVHRTGRSRAFWLGFALFGWAYLAAAQLPEVRTRLLTTRALIRLGKLVPTVSVDLTYNQDPGERSKVLKPDGETRPEVVLGINPRSGSLWATLGGITQDFYRIGDSLWALILGFLGGHLSRGLVKRRE